MLRRTEAQHQQLIDSIKIVIVSMIGRAKGGTDEEREVLIEDCFRGGS